MIKIICFLLIPVSLSLFVYLYFTRPRPPLDSSSIPQTLFTPDQLSKFTGVDNTPIYLSIVGLVFDVTNGRTHYGPGGSYHFFVGLDGSRAFVTGHFDKENLIPNISDLGADTIGSLNDWLVFYKGKYPQIGKLVGHYFDELGNPTDNYRDFEFKLQGSSLEKEKEKEFSLKYPRCNSKWQIDQGGEVWCDAETAKIGGVDRDWIGVPRKYYKKPGSRNFDCICVKTEEAVGNKDMFKPYDKCGETDNAFRKEHYFDPAPLLSYLQATLPPPPKPQPTLHILQFNGGQSNPTFYLNYSGQELVLRKKPPGKLLPGAHAVDREYTIISALSKVGFPVPEAIVYCSDTKVIGTEFYITKFLRGRIFRDPLLPGLMPEERKAIYLEMIRVLAQLHNYKPKDLGLENYSKVDRNYYQRQIETWTRNYKASETHKIDSMNNLIDWLPQNIPPNTSELVTINHGDFRLENIIFHETEPRIIAVLDWELSSLGHPYSDLGYNCLPYHMKKTKRAVVPSLGKFDVGTYGVPSEKRMVEEYCRHQGLTTEAIRGPADKYWKFYLSFALFRLVGIGQGVYKRSLQGNASSTTAGSFDKLTRLVAELGWKIANPVVENPVKTPNVLEMFGFSEKCKTIQKKLIDFMEEHIYPNERVYFSQISKDPARRWKDVPPIMEELKEKAKAAGLWNLFLPSEGPKLSVFEYASICESIGRSIIAPEVFNCGAPDTGNMEVLHLYGNKAQQEKWLKPLLEGEIRSCFAMTEPRVASSDATNIETSITKDPLDPNYYIVNGRKWWISGAGDPRCKIAIVMGKTPNPKKPAHEQQTMILVPFDTEGVIRVRPLTVFGFDDAPIGHWELIFNNVRVHKENLLLDEGKGFMIAQGRLGPGRIHHCMRLIGLATRAFESMCIRATNRTAFGKLLMDHGTVMSHIAHSKIEIEQCRLLTLYAAKCIDTFGTKGAKKEIAAIKVAAPNMACRVIDRAIQVHGGGGLSEDFMLATAYSWARTLRIADGPDDVHEMSIAKMEMEEYIEAKL